MQRHEHHNREKPEDEIRSAHFLEYHFQTICDAKNNNKESTINIKHMRVCRYSVPHYSTPMSHAADTMHESTVLAIAALAYTVYAVDVHP